MNGNRFAWGAASSFVIATLVTIIVIPIVVQRRVDERRETIQASEPARTILMALQFNLVRELAALNELGTASNSTAAQTFRMARATERDLWSELEPLTRQLGTDVHGQFVHARTMAEQWHSRLNEDEVLAHPDARVSILQVGDVRQRFREVLAEISELDVIIRRSTERSREHIERAEQSGLTLTLFSGALAIVASAIVAALVLRLRRLAAETERRRRQATDALEEAARSAEARQRLLRGVTHDVKNPLGAARGYAEILGMEIKGELNADQKQLVEGVDRSINSALAIISDLLDLARADSGGIHVQRIQIDLNDVAREAVADHQAAAEAAGHQINARISDGAPVGAFTDPTRVRQVVDNLISNAIKYTPAPGQITVAVNAKANDAPFGKGAVAIRVTDNGPGIPPEHRETIFNEFTRLDDQNAMKGHGLGLAIARRIARLLGGDLGLGEPSARGATFVLWLPQREKQKTTSG
jgi:signal transduction histidine kinase